VELGWIMERRVVWAEVVGARAEVVGARAKVVGTRAAVWGAASTFDIAIADPKTIDFREKVTTRWMNEMNDNSGKLIGGFVDFVDFFQPVSAFSSSLSVHLLFLHSPPLQPV